MFSHKTIYKIDCIGRFHNYSVVKDITKIELFKEFISFLRNRQMLRLQITKINDIVISENQTWEYDENKGDFVLETDCRGGKSDLSYKSKYID